MINVFFFSSRRRHTRSLCDWSSDVCSSDLNQIMNLSTRAQNAGIASNSKTYERELLPYGDPRKLPPTWNSRTQGIFEYWIEDGTFVKLRELSASYTLNTLGVRRYFADGIDLTLS